MRGRIHKAAGALLLASLVLVPVLGAAADERTYVAQSLWSAKHLAGVDAGWLKSRPLWMEKVSGAGVRVGIVSTGVDPGHPDLDGAVAGWNDLVSGRAEPYDDHGYGTFLAGVVAARGHVQWNPFEPYWITGARGLAPEAQLLVAKAVSADGDSRDADVARAVDWLLDPDGDGSGEDAADVILLPTVVERPRRAPSLADPLDLGSETRESVQRAVARGVTVVSSAGNNGTALKSPADLQAVVTVGAVDRTGQPAGFNGRGVAMDLLAPGILVGPWPEATDTYDFASDGYASVAGTGAAAAFVAGSVALLLEGDPSLRAQAATPEEGRAQTDRLQGLLKSHAQPFKDTKPEEQGAGMIAAGPALVEADRGVGALDLGLVGTVAALAFGTVVLFVRAKLAKRKPQRAAPEEE